MFLVDLMDSSAGLFQLTLEYQPVIVTNRNNTISSVDLIKYILYIIGTMH